MDWPRSPGAMTLQFEALSDGPLPRIRPPKSNSSGVTTPMAGDATATR